MSDTKRPDLHAVPVAETGRLGENDSDLEDGLTPAESVFVRSLVDGASVEDAASVAGISARSGRRWRHKPAVVAALREHSRASVAQATAVLASGSTRAALSLVAIADDKRKASAPVVQAARAVLEFASKGTELADIEERLTTLEQQIANTPGTFRGRA
jgi:hypothetical protein